MHVVGFINAKAHLAPHNLRRIGKLTRARDQIDGLNGIFHALIASGWTHNLKRQLRDTPPEIIQRQIFENDIGQPLIARHVACALDRFDQRVRQLVFSAMIQAPVHPGQVQRRAIGPGSRNT